MGNYITHSAYVSSPSPYPERFTHLQEPPHTPPRKKTPDPSSENIESSRVFFLLYLIHRTWNVVLQSVDSKRKRKPSMSDDSGAPQSIYDGSTSSFEVDFDVIDDKELKVIDKKKINDDQSSVFGSQYSFCSCSYCFGSKKEYTEEYSIGGMRLSICER
ncbi:hypothetical protein ACFFRR_000993 [Megaselia abdita]